MTSLFSFFRKPRKVSLLLSLLLMFQIAFGTVFAVSAWSAPQMDIWWPTDRAVVQGVQPFKALLQGKNLGEYGMYWQVDGGHLNPMWDSYEGYPHKEALVDLSGWDWKGQGPYAISFVAKEHNGAVLQTRSVDIYLESQIAEAQEPEPVAPAPVAVHIEPESKTVEVWWPAEGGQVQGAQPFKAILKEADLWEYRMFWQVEGGGLNEMVDSWQDYPHKESWVDLSGWNWKGAGPYTLSFVAQDLAGNEIARHEVSIFTDEIVEPEPILFSVQKGAYSENPFAEAELYVDSGSPAAMHAAAFQGMDSLLLSKIASHSGATWFGDWNSNIYKEVKAQTDVIAGVGALPVYVLYNIPKRDCGSWSAGGAQSPESYLAWIDSVASAIGERKAAVILEPDALANMDCLSFSDRQTRLKLLSSAGARLSNSGSIAVYLDAGHPRWIEGQEMARRLKDAGIAGVRGFSLNVSNFFGTEENIEYGKRVAELVGDKPFVIDTSRNGMGANGEWCNPSGRALGLPPKAVLKDPLVDALLWIKVPGESDGQCNGGPSAGVFWLDYALGLASRASW